ncbi:hypothetical protein MLD38_033749 [Melastoma candidum]|uniref:Uncharacterized protein n=1 Tax=Melastoma candidum TaxID=119954 RepID=A0ACB9M942_9MYRT|nr:hypothetical protein MLD38_033749 [Melastoma candidum]
MDRSKDVIISGGASLGSVEVESVLFGHLAENEVAVAWRGQTSTGGRSRYICELKGAACRAEAADGDGDDRLLQREDAKLHGAKDSGVTGRAAEDIVQEDAEACPLRTPQAVGSTHIKSAMKEKQQSLNLASFESHRKFRPAVPSQSKPLLIVCVSISYKNVTYM